MTKAAEKKRKEGRDDDGLFIGGGRGGSEMSPIHIITIRPRPSVCLSERRICLFSCLSASQRE